MNPVNDALLPAGWKWSKVKPPRQRFRFVTRQWARAMLNDPDFIGAGNYFPFDSKMRVIREIRAVPGEIGMLAGVRYVIKEKAMGTRDTVIPFDEAKMRATLALLDFHFDLVTIISQPGGNINGDLGTSKDNSHMVGIPGMWRFLQIGPDPKGVNFFVADKAWRKKMVAKAGGSTTKAPMICRNVLAEYPSDGHRQFRSPWALLRQAGVTA